MTRSKSFAPPGVSARAVRFSHWSKAKPGASEYRRNCISYGVVSTRYKANAAATPAATGCSARRSSHNAVAAKKSGARYIRLRSTVTVANDVDRYDAYHDGYDDADDDCPVAHHGAGHVLAEDHE